MLRLFGAVPLPKSGQTRITGTEKLRVLQQPVGEDGSEVFVRRRDRQRMPDVSAGKGRLAFRCSRTPLVVEPQFLQVLVIEAVQPAMSRLLSQKSLHLVFHPVAELFRQSL